MAELFRHITVGVYIIGVAVQEKRNAFTAAWLMPVSFQPLLLALSINPNNASYSLLVEGGGFSVNVLGQDEMALAEHFGVPAQGDKLANVQWRPGTTGAPILENVSAYFECELVSKYPAGDHVLIVGQVIGGQLLQADTQPLIYRDTGDMDNSSSLFPNSF
jgi:flavin reductase (DIM6/NTAB) family NADH-FMN oxidoreductase RutF